MKFRTKLTITALAALSLMVAACSQPPTDHYPTFSQAMDQLVGPGKWSAKSHTNAKDDLLTVSGLSIKLPAVALPAEAGDQPRVTGADGTVETSPAPKPTLAQEQTLEIATVEVKKPLDKKTLEAIIAASDWKNQKETKLADSVVLKGVSYKALNPVGLEFSIEESSIKAPSLSAAGAEAPAGRAGFLKALRLDELSYKNFKAQSKSPEAEAQFVAGSAAVQGVAFDGEMFAGLDSLDPSGLSGVMSAMSAKSMTMKDMVVDIKDPGGQFTGKMTLASVEEKDVKAMGSFGEVTMNDFKFDLLDEKKRPTAISLAKLNLRGFDMSHYMNRMMPVIISAGQNPAQAEQLMAGFYTLGDIFVMPFSLDEVSLSGFSADVAGLMSFKLAEAKGSGPYRAGQIPASKKSSMSGLEIILPEDAAKAAQDPEIKELYEFGQKFGMTRFVIDSEGEGSYDAESGKVVSTLTRLTVKDLVEFSGSGEMGGLTPERLEKLNSTPLSMITLALMAPDAVFGDLAFHKLNVKLDDKGLTDRLLAYAALEASEQGATKLTAEDIRQQMLTNLPVLITMKGSEYLANPEVLVKTLTEFFKKPGSLELKLAADPPLGVQSFMAMGGDQNQILNSLNLSLSANGEEAPALKFAIGN